MPEIYTKVMQITIFRALEAAGNSELILMPTYFVGNKI